MGGEGAKQPHTDATMSVEMLLQEADEQQEEADRKLEEHVKGLRRQALQKEALELQHKLKEQPDQAQRQGRSNPQLRQADPDAHEARHVCKAQ